VTFAPLETVILERDLREHGLRRGDLGAVVEVYESDGLEVEFVRASGRSQALVESAMRTSSRFARSTELRKKLPNLGLQQTRPAIGALEGHCTRAREA